MRKISNVVLIILVGVVCVLSIWFRNYHTRLLREELLLEKRLTNLRSESLSLRSELMNISKESSVFRELRDRNMRLEPSRTPPVLLEYVER